MGAEEVVAPSPLLDARNEQELIHIRNEVEKGKLPADVADNLEELYCNYTNAVLLNGDPNAYEIVLSNTMALFDRVLLDVENPFTLPPLSQCRQRTIRLLHVRSELHQATDRF